MENYCDFFSSMVTDWNFWLLFVTAGTAVVALFQSNKQVKLSNKQHLFDKRLEIYLMAQVLLQAYELTCSDFEKGEPKTYSDFSFLLEFLTQNAHLEKYGKIIAKSTKKSYLKEINNMMDDLENLVVKISFLFSRATYKLLALFVWHYKNVLYNMYWIQRSLGDLKEEKASNGEYLDYEELWDLMNDNKYRKKLEESLEILNKIFVQMVKKNTMGKIEKKIKF